MAHFKSWSTRTGCGGGQAVSVCAHKIWVRTLAKVLFVWGSMEKGTWYWQMDTKIVFQVFVYISNVNNVSNCRFSWLSAYTRELID